MSDATRAPLSDTRAPLSDTRVLDVSRFVAGPLCTFFLASMGAEVIAIEPPTPSASRRMPPLAGPDGGARDDYVDGALSIPFLKRARGKRSVALDIRRPEGQALVRRLVARADVFVENSKPGTMDEFGLGHAALRAAHPRLVTCAISGYGQRDTERPAMDVIVQAVSGAMAKTGFPDGPPLRAGITIADHTTATFAALGIVAALRQRDHSGVGQLVDVSMLDVLTALVYDEPVDHYAAAGLPVRTGNADARGAPINSYRCADGWVAVTCTSDGQFERLCELMGEPALRDRFPNVRARALHAREVDAAIEAWTSMRSARDVEAAFVRIGFPAGRVREPVEAAQDPAVRDRALLEPLRHPHAPAGEPSGFLGARLPIVFEGRVDLTPAEPLGTSTDAVLREVAQCDDDELAHLRAEHVIR
jgi:CoA:oxalate CoA-transferase